MQVTLNNGMAFNLFWLGATNTDSYALEMISAAVEIANDSADMNEVDTAIELLEMLEYDCGLSVNHFNPVVSYYTKSTGFNW